MKTTAARAWYVGILYSVIAGGMTIGLTELEKLAPHNTEAAKWALILSICSMVVRSYIDRTVAQVPDAKKEEEV